jgi:hypothetical protein
MIGNFAYENQGNLDKLIQQISLDQCCVFVGSGLSIPAGYPSWPALVESLELAAKNLPNYVPCNPSLSAWKKGEALRDMLGDNAFHSQVGILFDPFGKEDYRVVHEVMMGIPFHGFITRVLC